MTKITLILSVTFLCSIILSSLFIRVGIPWVKKEKIKKTWFNPFRDFGFWLGVFETLIIFILVINREYGALAIIFGAKEIVRKDEIAADPAYYLLGTMINFGLALLFAEIAIWYCMPC